MPNNLERLYADLAAAFRAEREGRGEECPRLVPGEGPLGPPLMLVGEAPGHQEALAGRPFVGPAGKQLDALLERTNLSREALYVTNTVKYRPTRISPAGRVVNRTPGKGEVAWFLPWLRREVSAVAPGLIATLGNTALCALAGPGARIGALHGRPLILAGLPAPLFPLYHPASILYNPSLKARYLEDLDNLAQWLTGQNDT